MLDLDALQGSKRRSMHNVQSLVSVDIPVLVYDCIHQGVLI